VFGFHNNLRRFFGTLRRSSKLARYRWEQSLINQGGDEQAGRSTCLHDRSFKEPADQRRCSPEQVQEHFLEALLMTGFSDISGVKPRPQCLPQIPAVSTPGNVLKPERNRGHMTQAPNSPL
jgi:hypothetical protein